MRKYSHKSISASKLVCTFVLRSSVSPQPSDNRFCDYPCIASWLYLHFVVGKTNPADHRMPKNGDTAWYTCPGYVLKRLD